MATIKDILIYFCKEYPHKAELSKARLTKMVYLADWKSAIDRKKTLTDIEWVYNHYGPYVDDVWSTVRKERDIFKSADETNFYGSSKEVVMLVSEDTPDNLENEERKILDKIIEVTKEKYWNDFISLVYSTYPVRKSERYDSLNLVKLAKEYKLEKIFM